MITAQEARKMVNRYYYTGFNIDQEILIAASQGKREYMYANKLPSGIRGELEANGYIIVEEWDSPTECFTYIRW